MSRRPVHRKATVESRRLQDRPLLVLGPDDEVWADGLLPAAEIAYGIVWVKPPPGINEQKLLQLVAVIKEKGAHVKLLPADRVDAVATEARPVAVAELGLQDARETVYELCRELAPRAGVDPEDAIREAETYLSAAGL